MNFKNMASDLTSEDRGVSPVIGVILMVAITVILAAVIGTFVLGLGDKVSGGQAPQANFNAEYDGDTDDDGTDTGFGSGDTDDQVTLTHAGGDSIDAARLTIKVAGQDNPGGGFSGTVTAGDSVTVASGDVSSGNLQTGDEVKIVWTSEDGSSSQTLLDQQIP